MKNDQTQGIINPPRFHRFILETPFLPPPSLPPDHLFSLEDEKRKSFVNRQTNTLSNGHTDPIYRVTHPKTNWNSSKELSLCHKLKFTNPYICIVIVA